MNRSISPVRLFIPLGLGLSLSLFADSLLYSVLPKPEIAAQFGITVAFTGVILGVNRLVRVFINQWVGSLFDRLPRRPIMLLGSLIAALSTLLYIFADNGLCLIIGRITFGLAWSGMWIGSCSMVLDISHDNDRGRISGIFSLVHCLAIAFTNFSIGMIFDWLGLRNSLWFSFFIGLLQVLIWLFFLPETRPSGKLQDDISESGTDVSVTPNADWITEPKNILKKSILVGIPSFSVNFVFTGVVYSTGILWLGSFFNDGVTIFSHFIPIATLTGYYGAVRTLTGTIGGPFSGIVSDRLHSRKSALLVTLIVVCVSTFLLGSRIFLLSLFGGLVAGIGIGAIPTLVYAWIGDKIVPTSKSSSIGIVNTLADIGSGLGPIIAMILIPLLGVSTVYGLMGFLFAASLVAVMKL